MKIKASLFNKSSPSAAVHAEHINVSTDFSCLFDINDDLLESHPTGSLELSKNINKSMGPLVANTWNDLCDYMRFEDSAKLLLLRRILWPLLSTENLPKCVTGLQPNNNQPTDPMCSEFFGRCKTDKCQVPWTSRGNQKVSVLRLLSQQCECIHDIISCQSWADWWW